MHVPIEHGSNHSVAVRRLPLQSPKTLQLPAQKASLFPSPFPEILSACWPLSPRCFLSLSTAKRVYSLTSNSKHLTFPLTPLSVSLGPAVAGIPSFPALLFSLRNSNKSPLHSYMHVEIISSTSPAKLDPVYDSNGREARREERIREEGISIWI